MHDILIMSCQCSLNLCTFSLCYVLSHNFLAVCNRGDKTSVQRSQRAKTKMQLQKIFCLQPCQNPQPCLHWREGDCPYFEGFQSIGRHWGLAYAIHQPFSMLHQHHFSLLLPRTVPSQNQGSSGLWQLFLLSQEKFWMSDTCWSKVWVHNLQNHPAWAGIDHCGSGVGDAEEDSFCTELSDKCLCSVNSPTLCDRIYIESLPSGQTFPALWIHKTVSVLRGSLWAAFHGETTWACTAQKQSQDTLSSHRDKSVHSSHHIVLPPSSGHPSGRKSSYITMGVCPAWHIWVPVWWPSQPCWIIMIIAIFNICGGGEEGPSGLSLQVFSWVFPDCLVFGLSGLHWDKFLTSKLCLLILISRVSFPF